MAMRMFSYRLKSTSPVLSCTQRPTALRHVVNRSPADDRMLALAPSPLASPVLRMSSCVVRATTASMRARSSSTYEGRYGLKAPLMRPSRASPMKRGSAASSPPRLACPVTMAPALPRS